METITVTVKTLDGQFKKTTDVPLDMLIQDFKEQAEELANLPGPNNRLYFNRKNNRVLEDTETFQSAGIQSGDTLTLTPLPEGGY